METVTLLLKKTYPEKILTLCPDNDYQKIAEQKNNVGLLSGYQAALTTYSALLIPPETIQGSDWCDAYQEDPLAAIEAFAQKQPVNPFLYACARLRCFGQGNQSISLKKACVFALQTGSRHYPAKFSEAEILAQVTTATAHTRISPETIKGWWYKIKRRAFAMALRAKTVNQQQNQGISILTVNNIQAAHDAADALKQQHPKAIFITNAPMGTGKTKDFIQPAFMASESRGDIPVVITPTKALTKGVSERFGASHYIDDMQQKETQYVGHTTETVIPSALAITINSIIAAKFNDILRFSRAVFIDEYTQVLRAITSGTVDNHRRRDTEAMLASLIQKSDYTYIADADFNQIALDQLKDIATDRPIFVFQTTVADQPDDVEPVTYHHLQHKDPRFASKFLAHTAAEAVQSGQRIYMASDSKTQLETLASALAASDHQVLLITSDNANFDAQRDFLDNPNTYLDKHQPDAVLVSPCVQSGVSIERPYFDRCFGIYTNTVSPVVFQQMLHRVRSQRHFEMALPMALQTAPKDTENATALLIGAYAEHIEKLGGVSSIQYDPETKTHKIGRISLQEDNGDITIQGDTAYARYEKLSAKLQALDNQQSHHAGNYVLLHALARRIVLQAVPVEVSPERKSGD